MCGIFGINIAADSVLASTDVQNLLNKTFLLSERRGKDASGLLSISQASIDVLKSPVRTSHLLRSTEYKKIVRNSLQNYNTGQSFSFMGHTRMATGGSEENNDNNQPVFKGNTALIHNGIIVNEIDILSENNLPKEYGVDSEVLLSLFNKNRAKGYDHLQSFQLSIDLLKGANTFALFSGDSEDILLHSSNKSLYLFHDNELKISMFSSERNVLKAALKILSKKSNKINPESMIYSDLNEVYAINYESSNLTILDIKTDIKFDPQEEPKKLFFKREILNHEIKNKNKAVSKIILNEYSSIEKNINIDHEQINNLIRCSKCVLPVTFPDIFFDEAGVCNYCNFYNRIELANNDRFLQDKINWKNEGSVNDVLVPLSGGRDSCYGLHYVKHELKLNPVAYTYDWGFVTDIARRNISRMCGEMNVEHVLVAADIKTKRNNVSKNVKAWLAKPEISLVPLFMAGDKFFYKYASLLKKEMNLSAIIFSLHALEVTNFKTGFANVNEKQAQEKLTGLSSLNKAKLISHYLINFLKNPRYLNSTIPETFMAFLYYYVKGRDYYSIFDYIPWEEDKIISVIKNQYGWEGSADEKLTWRIGDGTAPFYNYIYLRHSGFCENDTFRSNQIREGLITREYALESLNIENKIDPESYKWYCDTIDIDASEALKKINASFKIRQS
jgi:glutamine---fructose-6-phosphate transaminase (isomerizing)